MNNEVAPMHPPCRFRTPTAMTPIDFVPGATSRHINHNLANNPNGPNERRLLLHYFPITLSLPSLNGGHTTADGFALVTLAQLIDRRDLKLYMPTVCRREDVGSIRWALGWHTGIRHRSLFLRRHLTVLPTENDKECYLNIIYVCYHAMQQGLGQWNRAVQQRIANYKLTAANGGITSLCFSTSEILRFIHDPTSVSFAGIYTCDHLQLPEFKLRSALREIVMWFCASNQTALHPRLFVLIEINHKVVMVMYDRAEQNLTAFDLQLDPNSEAPPVTGQQPQQHQSIHHRQRGDLQSGIRVAVACAGELPMLCFYLCNEVFNSFGTDSTQTVVRLEYFVVGQQAALTGEAWH